MSSAGPQDDSVAGQVTLRYWAAARAAAGVSEEYVDVAGPLSLAELVRIALLRHPDSPGFGAVLGTCSVLLGDRPVATESPENVVVAPGQVVEFLPPFAGG